MIESRVVSFISIAMDTSEIICVSLPINDVWTSEIFEWLPYYTRRVMRQVSKRWNHALSKMHLTENEKLEVILSSDDDYHHLSDHAVGIDLSNITIGFAPRFPERWLDMSLFVQRSRFLVSLDLGAVATQNLSLLLAEAKCLKHLIMPHANMHTPVICEAPSGLVDYQETMTAIARDLLSALDSLRSVAVTFGMHYLDMACSHGWAKTLTKLDLAFARIPSGFISNLVNLQELRVAGIANVSDNDLSSLGSLDVLSIRLTPNISGNFLMQISPKKLFIGREGVSKCISHNLDSLHVQERLEYLAMCDCHTCEPEVFERVLGKTKLNCLAFDYRTRLDGDLRSMLRAKFPDYPVLYYSIPADQELTGSAVQYPCGNVASEYVFKLDRWL